MAAAFLFDQDIADKICERLQDGDTIREICSTEGMPCWNVIRKWKLSTPQFATQYARAYLESAEACEEECIAISKTAKDKDSAAAARVQIDVLKWCASKRNKAKYGDHMQVDHSGELSIRTLTDEQLLTEINAIIAPPAGD